MYDKCMLPQGSVLDWITGVMLYVSVMMVGIWKVTKGKAWLCDWLYYAAITFIKCMQSLAVLWIHTAQCSIEVEMSCCAEVNKEPE